MYLLRETYSDLPGHLWCHLPFWGIEPKEGKMMKQMSFKLNEHEKLQMVWSALPESNQKEIKRALRETDSSGGQIGDLC